MKPILCLSVIAIFLIACNSETKSNQKLIIGSWIPERHDKEKTDQRVIFLENHIAVNKTRNEQPEPRDSVTYKLSDDGKTLTTTERNGKIEELTILKLTEQEMVLLMKGNENKNDTFRFKKE